MPALLPHLGQVMTERDIFIAALQREDAIARAVFLGEVCGVDANLRLRIERLLRLHDDAGSFLQNPAEPQFTDAYRPPEANPRFASTGAGWRPHWTLQTAAIAGSRRHGNGLGRRAGTAGEASRRAQAHQGRHGFRASVARFEAERQALALMDHTNIAKVLDVGATPKGRPYFAMELVKGVPISKYCDELHLSVRERLNSLCPSAKPSNTRTKGESSIATSSRRCARGSLQDGKPVPKVIDFGLAKALTSAFERSIDVHRDRHDRHPGIHEPRASRIKCGTNIDAPCRRLRGWEFCSTNCSPARLRWTAKRLKHAAFEEMLRIIREEEPLQAKHAATSSQDALAGLAKQAALEPARLTKKHIRGELDWIVMKCLEKDRTRRLRNGQRASTGHRACPPERRVRRSVPAKHRLPAAKIRSQEQEIVGNRFGICASAPGRRRGQRLAGGARDPG